MARLLRNPARLLKRVPVEAVVWTIGLAAMACANPEADGLIEGCLSKWLFGVACPGCGLGHAVAYLFRGEVLLSFQTHPLGPLAVVILGGHVVHLVWDAFTRPPFETI